MKRVNRYVAGNPSEQTQSRDSGIDWGKLFVLVLIVVLLAFFWLGVVLAVEAIAKAPCPRAPCAYVWRHHR